ncbi:MAG: hypothetical protein Q9195_009585 [Heterodermia aff. obscurata]
MAPIRPAAASSVTSHRHSQPTPTLSSLRRKSGKDRGIFGITSKKDKRTIKHSALISRIEKTKATPKKRRRPSKKLVTDLDSLAAALPDVPIPKNEDSTVGGAMIRHKSLKSRPGAIKRKEKLAHMEKDRFNKNMALMMTSDNTRKDDKSVEAVAGERDANRDRWASLRGFIKQTMEPRPEPDT